MASVRSSQKSSSVVCRALVLFGVAALSVACEPADGTSYGVTVIYGSERETCGLEKTVGIAGANPDYIATVEGQGWTWLESSANSVCRPSGETGDRFESVIGWLGNSVRLTENGVTCAFNTMSYNGAKAYYYFSDASCSNDYPTDQYRTQVVHRWWSTGTGTYGTVTRNSPIYNI